MSGGPKLMVRSLPYVLREDKLRSMFEPFGELVECKLIMDRENPDRSRGFGFITYRDPQVAQTALESMDNYQVDGRYIRVQFAEDRGGRSSRGGGGGGPPQSRMDNRRESSRNDRYNNNDNRRSDYGSSDRRDRDRSPGRDRRDNSRNNEQPGVRTGGEMMDPSNDNSRIYITGLPESTTEAEIAEYFGQIGVVARKKQKRGFPDQWPFKISIYVDEQGKAKGDAALTYVDPNAAQSAPGFFNDTEFKGSKITVQMSTSSQQPKGRSEGRDGGGGGGGRRYGGGGGGGGGYGNRGHRDSGRGYRGGGGGRY